MKIKIEIEGRKDIILPTEDLSVWMTNHFLVPDTEIGPMSSTGELYFSGNVNYPYCRALLGPSGECEAVAWGGYNDLDRLC
jgi:hypothetical protein